MNAPTSALTFLAEEITARHVEGLGALSPEDAAILRTTVLAAVEEALSTAGRPVHEAPELARHLVDLADGCGGGDERIFRSAAALLIQQQEQLRLIDAVRTLCHTMDRGVGYRVSGRHETWGVYEEGQSDFAAHVLDVIDPPDLDHLLGTPVYELDVTVRAHNVLHGLLGPLATLRQLVALSFWDVLDERNVGQKTITSIALALKGLGLSMRNTPPQLAPALTSPLEGSTP